MSCFLWNDLPADCLSEANDFYERSELQWQCECFLRGHYARLSKEEIKKVADSKKQGMFMQLEQRNKIRKSFVYVMCSEKIVYIYIIER